eukprot:CAMPEP_0182546890 /NCGR_PEP_ID=MMETSP1323-20130603/36689_1 /TAXON_ID=236787 /ORGANISM="Florenciella parvula, Strain RCC1693" /LENGTH=36 /DNA_ID= /DNA_START= /DNA_END= /DNA_ORIENTATION=
MSNTQALFRQRFDELVQSGMGPTEAAAAALQQMHSA